MIDISSPVAELLLEQPSRARVFEGFGIDYCCGGNVPLEEACGRRGLDRAEVVVALEAADEAAAVNGSGEKNWREAPLEELCGHIIAAHHDRLRVELPRLSTLLEKCERAHGADCPELAPIRATFEELRGELEVHMAEEETRLFPHCRAGVRLKPAFLAQLEDDHAATGAGLARLRELTGGYDLGRARCNTHRATIDGLRELELDTHRHIHEENNILFPRMRAAAPRPDHEEPTDGGLR
jgi:regulator of cell morphogenesis and NO signaling